MTTQYMPAVGTKFYEDGTVRQFPGNTIICFVDPDSETFRLSVWLQEELRRQLPPPGIALLPVSSLHMTVFQLVVDEVRQPEKWSSHLPLDAPLADTDAFFMRVVPGVPAPGSFRMRYRRLKVEGSGISIRLEPADDEAESAIRQYRADLVAATGVRFPDHDDYEFHISLAYNILRRTDAQEAQLTAFVQRVDAIMQAAFGIFETGQPVLTFFDDMFRFVPAAQRHILISRRTDT